MVPVKPLHIAILGTRGVPPRYGGFETFAAELGTRLVERGHQVTVYCRRLAPSPSCRPLSPVPGPQSKGIGDRGPGTGDPLASWQGIRRIELPAIRHKYLETVSHGWLSALHALGQSFDAVLVCNAVNAFVLPLLRAHRTPTAINVDGIERQRKKWNRLGKMVYQIGESFSARFAHALIADAEVIADYYRANYSAHPVVIPYGSEFPAEADTDVLSRLGLASRRYLLYVSRIEPENNPIAVRDAYSAVRTEMPLVMVGDAPYSRKLIARLRDRSVSRVILPGAVYGADYRVLQRHAYVFIQATEVGGTHPALIEAMGSGGAVLANDTPENREVGGDSVGYFTLDSLAAALQRAVDHPAELEPMRERARARARSQYSWAAVTDAYEALFKRLAAPR